VTSAPVLRFAPGSAIWAVDREAALLLGAGRALLLQVAHPLVAAGVAQHSGFARDPWGRLTRTLETTYALVFGDPAAIARAVARLDAAHCRVRGRTAEGAGRFTAGTPYDAADPALRLWVHATLVDTSLLTYERFVAPLPAGRAAAYYQDSRRLGRLVGVPEALLPPALDDFRAYLTRMVAETITVGPEARRLAREIFRPPGFPALGLVGLVARFVTVGLLPATVREQYGYHWTPARTRLLEALARAVRTALPAVPPVLRVAPPARAAERRLRRQTPAA
jgi:uncharacterized protein (DUF2236 family)